MVRVLQLVELKMLLGAYMLDSSCGALQQYDDERNCYNARMAIAVRQSIWRERIKANEKDALRGVHSLAPAGNLS